MYIYQKKHILKFFAIVSPRVYLTEQSFLRKNKWKFYLAQLLLLCILLWDMNVYYLQCYILLVQENNRTSHNISWSELTKHIIATFIFFVEKIYAHLTLRCMMCSVCLKHFHFVIVFFLVCWISVTLWLWQLTNYYVYYTTEWARFLLLVQLSTVVSIIYRALIYCLNKCIVWSV